MRVLATAASAGGGVNGFAGLWVGVPGEHQLRADLLRRCNGAPLRGQNAVTRPAAPSRRDNSSRPLGRGRAAGWFTSGGVG